MNNEPKKNLLLMDINSHLSRAYHKALSKGLNELEGAYYEGKPRYIIPQAINLIENEIQKISRMGRKPDYICLIMDASGKNFRHELYPEYKANRPDRDEDYVIQREEILEILNYKGYSIIREEGVEADDVITTITKKAENVPNLNVTVATDDKDLLYLISDKTRLFRGKINKMYDIEACIKEKGVPPEKILDYLTLNGDKADNITGVPRLGEKTIPKVLEKYSVDQILENPEILEDQDLKVRGSKNIIKYIKENKEFISLMKKLVEMKEDLELGVALKNFKKKYEDQNKLSNKMKSLGMKH
jgi:DNA polymerase-1